MKEINGYNAPKGLSERQKRLEESIITLKTEFIGLDEIIDKIKDAISVWYLTPEVLRRNPVVVNLFGMSGTGKSSVCTRLMELLGVKGKTVYFDCGEIESKGTIIHQTMSTLGVDSNTSGLFETEDSQSPSTEIPDILKDLVFVFDEFQYAKTIDEKRQEILKSNYRPIWKLIDDGKLIMDESYDYDFNKLCKFIEDIEPLAKNHPGIKVDKLEVKDRDAVKLILEDVGFFHYDRSVPGLVHTEDYSYLDEDEKKKEDDKDPYRPLNFIPEEYIRSIMRRLNSIEYELGTQTVRELFECKTVEEIYGIIREAKKMTTAPKFLNCKHSLVFIIGNIDEAYVRAVGDTNPDMDADTFHDITSKISATDIKDALRERFRAEQIARLGNNMILYPTLKKEHFKKIIRMEVEKIIKYFKGVDPINIEVEEEIYNLLYVEGVFPTQGCRSIFSTINQILTPYLSKIVLEKGNSEKVILGLKDKDDWTVRGFKIAETEIELKFSNGTSKTYTYKLQLGAIRNPESRGTRYICSVHEAGHGIMMAYLTGSVPRNIVSVSTDHGGFCDTYNPEKEGEIRCRRDIDVDVMISLGGYEAEELIYNDRPEMRLMGSGSDIDRAWKVLNEAAYKTGYFEPVKFSHWDIADSWDQNTCPGSNMKTSKVWFNGSQFTLEDAVEKKMAELKEKTKIILKSEVKLLKALGLYLGERGSIDGAKFLKFVEEYGNKLTPKHMEEIKEKFSNSYYRRILEQPENEQRWY